ncbi:hypothetical protein [Sporosarcina sp. FSL K6-1508]|uniref:hypothetical protein n=1 Tax=Sporosarcina sp. FSL K6-1508 TaxID=2921553 RepID=UPI0030FCB405
MSEVQTFVGMDFGKVEIPVIVIYENPKDFPGEFVGRLFDGVKPTKWYAKGAHEVDVVGKIPTGFVRLERAYLDEPHIVCTYF